MACIVDGELQSLDGVQAETWIVYCSVGANAWHSHDSPATKHEKADWEFFRFALQEYTMPVSLLGALQVTVKLFEDLVAIWSSRGSVKQKAIL